MDSFSGRKVLVTGASGFVGQRLCRALLAQGAEVIGVCRDAERARTQWPEIDWRSAQIGPDTDWSGVPFGQIDVVFHLAAHVHQPLAGKEDQASQFFAVNVAGTERLARAAAGHVRRFVFVSSSHAMATLTDELLNEFSTCRPDSPYGQSKLEAEQRLAAVRAETGLVVTIARPPAVYGPGLKGHLAPLIRLVKLGVPLPLASVVNQRSLIFVDNLVDALLTCAAHEHAANETYVVSDGQNVTLPELIREISLALGRSPRLVPFPVSLLKAGGSILGKSSLVERLLGSLAVDLANIRGQLGWEPPYTLAHGLRATVAALAGEHTAHAGPHRPHTLPASDSAKERRTAARASD